MQAKFKENDKGILQILRSSILKCSNPLFCKRQPEKMVHAWKKLVWSPMLFEFLFRVCAIFSGHLVIHSSFLIQIKAYISSSQQTPVQICANTTAYTKHFTTQALAHRSNLIAS
jgi:hypothetical protein